MRPLPALCRPTLLLGLAACAPDGGLDLDKPEADDLGPGALADAPDRAPGDGDPADDGADDPADRPGGGGGSGDDDDEDPLLGLTGGDWLATALETCTVNFLWLKDEDGDLNAGPDLGAGYPALIAVEDDRLVFASETLAAYSGGWIGGQLVLRVLSVDPATGVGRVDGAVTGGDLEVRLEAHEVGPDPLILEDGVAQSPSDPAAVIFADGREHPAAWGLVFSPWSSAGEPACVRRARALGF